MIVLIYEVFFDSAYRFDGYSSYNLMPFETIRAMLSNYSHVPDVAIINLAGNILAFIPLGLLVPIILRSFENIRRIFLLGVGTSLTIELIQFIFRVGAFDIDDILLNAAGAIVGYSFYRLLAKNIFYTHGTPTA